MLFSFLLQHVSLAAHALHSTCIIISSFFFMSSYNFANFSKRHSEKLNPKVVQSYHQIQLKPTYHQV